MKTKSNPDGEIHIQMIKTVNQLADIMTKGLVEAKFVPLQDWLMGWDLDKETEAQELNLHSRGSVENVSLVLSNGPIAPCALTVALNAPQLHAAVCGMHQHGCHLWPSLIDNWPLLVDTEFLWTKNKTK